MNKQVEFCVTFKERLQERIRVESELREEKTRLLNVVKRRKENWPRRGASLQIDYNNMNKS